MHLGGVFCLFLGLLTSGREPTPEHSADSTNIQLGEPGKFIVVSLKECE